MYPATCLGEQQGSFQAPRSPHLPFVIPISVSRTPRCHRIGSAGQLILLGSDIFPEAKRWRRGVPYFVWMELNFYTLVWTPSRHPHQGWWALQYTPGFRRASSAVTEPTRRMNAPDAGCHKLSLTHWVLSLTPHKGHLRYSQESEVETDVELTYPKVSHFLFAKLYVTVRVQVHINVRVCLCVSVSVCVCARSKVFLSFILLPKPWFSLPAKQTRSCLSLTCQVAVSNPWPLWVYSCIHLSLFMWLSSLCLFLCF